MEDKIEALKLEIAAKEAEIGTLQEKLDAETNETKQGFLMRQIESKRQEILSMRQEILMRLEAEAKPSAGAPPSHRVSCLPPAFPRSSLASIPSRRCACVVHVACSSLGLCSSVAGCFSLVGVAVAVAAVARLRFAPANPHEISLRVVCLASLVTACGVP